MHPDEQVGEAVCLDSLSYHEAWELSYFGASVLHPRTTMPAMKYNIPITIRNFFNRGASGEASIAEGGSHAKVQCQKVHFQSSLLHQSAAVILPRLGLVCMQTLRMSKGFIHRGRHGCKDISLQVQAWLASDLCSCTSLLYK